MVEEEERGKSEVGVRGGSVVESPHQLSEEKERGGGRKRREDWLKRRRRRVELKEGEEGEWRSKYFFLFSTSPNQEEV